jgi:hypothetical protein
LPKPGLPWIVTTEAFCTLPSPEGLSLALQALWHDARGDWERAHELAQQAGNADGDWVHAYLHRKEGDEGNAGYWYSRAGRKKSAETVDKEWTQIAVALLAR